MAKLWPALILFFGLLVATWTIAPSPVSVQLTRDGGPLVALIQYYKAEKRITALSQSRRVLLRTTTHSRFESPSKRESALRIFGPAQFQNKDTYLWQREIFQPWREEPYPFFSLKFDSNQRLVKIELLDRKPSWAGSDP